MVDANKTRRLFAAGAALALGLVTGAAPAAPVSPSPALPPQKSFTAKSAANSSTAKKPAKRTSSRRRVVGQRAPTSDRIREIQSALTGAGVYSARPTGKWDQPTIAALKKFQHSKRLTPDGKLDARTLQSLGLGSHVAGLSPPRPPASSPDSQ